MENNVFKTYLPALPLPLPRAERVMATMKKQIIKRIHELTSGVLTINNWTTWY